MQIAFAPLVNWPVKGIFEELSEANLAVLLSMSHGNQLILQPLPQPPTRPVAALTGHMQLRIAGEDIRRAHLHIKMGQTVSVAEGTTSVAAATKTLGESNKALKTADDLLNKLKGQEKTSEPGRSAP